MTETDVTKPGKKKNAEPYWLIYISAILSGLLLIGYALDIGALQKISARLGIGLLFGAFALIVGRSRVAGYIAAGLVGFVVILTFFL